MREFATLLEQWQRGVLRVLYVCGSGMSDVLVVIQGISVLFCLLQEGARFIPMWEGTGLNDH